MGSGRAAKGRNIFRRGAKVLISHEARMRYREKLEREARVAARSSRRRTPTIPTALRRWPKKVAASLATGGA